MAAMLRQGLRVMARGAMLLLLAAALLAPLVPAGALADCCALTMPCCPERMAAPEGSASAPVQATLAAPVPACCQTLLPAGTPMPADRKGTPAAPAPIAVPFPSLVPQVTLAPSGRVLSFETAPAEDPPRESRSARAPPIA